MNGQIVYNNTIDRYAIALIRLPGQKLCARFERIAGPAYDHMEKYYPLSNFAGLEPYWADQR